MTEIQTQTPTAFLKVHLCMYECMYVCMYVYHDAGVEERDNFQELLSLSTR